MKHFLAGMTALTALMAAFAVQARATEATFERDLTVSGRVDLAINNGSGLNPSHQWSRRPRPHLCARTLRLGHKR